MNSSSLILIYKSLIHPVILYCSSLWGFAAKCHLNRVFVLQKKIIRILGNFSYRQHSAPFFSENRLLTVRSCSIYMTLVFVFKFVYFQERQNWFRFYCNISYRTRSSHTRNLEIPFFRTNHSRQSILYIGPKNWNSLPTEIRSIEDFNNFKRNVKLFLLELQMSEWN